NQKEPTAYQTMASDARIVSSFRVAKGFERCCEPPGNPLTRLGELGFTQVQLVLQFVQEFVADASLLAELNGGLAFDLQQLATDFDILVVERERREPARAFVQAVEPGAIVLREIVIYFGQFWLSVFTSALKVLQCGREDGASG